MLCLRCERPSLFIDASYVPLRGNPHVAAFARAAEGQTLVVAAPVLIATLTRGNLMAPMGEDVWRNEVIAVPSGTYEDLFTGKRHTPEGGTLRLSEVFGEFPVAALLAEN
jgi:maltooligosyltrehalose synthase